jgi:hypothetical protein
MKMVLHMLRRMGTELSCCYGSLATVKVKKLLLSQRSQEERGRRIFS